MTDQSAGLVCAHHHLYSSLARGMPAPERTPAGFTDILELVWWRLDTALDLEMIRWSAMLGALEALERGCTTIIDHHESPNAIEGSLTVIADACAEIGVPVRLWGDRSSWSRRLSPGPRGEPSVPRGGWSGDGRCPRRVHLQR
jgi:cytosine/adenosine deaminase-related metal-dependent hydrolase